MLISSKYDHDGMATPIFAIELSVLKGRTTSKRQLWYGLWYGIWKKVESDFSLLTWHHICWAYNNSTSAIRMVIDGDVVLDQVDMELLKKPRSIPKEFLTKMLIMRLSHPESVKNATYYSMMGKMTDVNIWNYTLSIEQMKNWTRCITCLLYTSPSPRD